tara:strand:- start:3981 stop:4454 length:474 start_codon:yes stop_codon:yes gene_type:complete
MFWLIILLSLALNMLYYFVSQKLKIKIFSRYFAGFILYSALIFILIIYLKLDYILINFFSFFTIYLLFFISLFLSISLKYIKSPTHIIFKVLNKKNTKKNIIKKLQKQKILEIRIKDLQKQNILEVKNNKMKLKKNLGIIINLIFYIKTFLKLKSEG